MRNRVEQFVSFFLKTFFLANFVIGTLTYIFTSNRMSPAPEPSTMLLIAVASAFFGVMMIFREGERN